MPDAGFPSRLRTLPRGVWVMGFGSLFMDISSELVHSLLPLFMATVLGASMVTIGLVEGIAEATAAFLKVISGTVSDRLKKRKPLMVLGYGLSAATKIIFPLATSLWWVFAARFIDRTGKGIRGAPRDALIADIAPPDMRGAAYGLRQALDSIGAFLGPVMAMVLMTLLNGNITLTLWCAVLPALVAVALLAAWVDEPRHHATPGHRPPPILTHVRRLPARFWFVVALGGLFTLARFSEAFLILRGQQLGMAITWAPAVLITMNAIYALFSYPAGRAADRVPTRTLLVLGLVALVAADVQLALADSPAGVLVGAGLWGLHMAMTQGLLSKLVADSVPADLRGTGFGYFNMVSGGALLAASVTAGALWSWMGPEATFAMGALFALAGALGFLLYRPAEPH